MTEVVSDWILRIIAGILLTLFAYLVGLRRAEKVSMTKSDCAAARSACLELLKQGQQKDEVIHDQKLLRIEDKMTSLEGKVDNVCKKMDSLRGMVLDYVRSQGFEERRRGFDPERDYRIDEKDQKAP